MGNKTHWKQEVSIARLKDVLIYAPDAGIFHWVISRRCVKAGEAAGTKNMFGYIAIKIDGRLYQAHRLAWLWITGLLPSMEIDHINRKRDDNRASNLREASSSQNKANTSLRVDNTSGTKGVSYCRQREKYVAQISSSGLKRNLGRYATFAEAKQAYMTASMKFNGDFMNSEA